MTQQLGIGEGTVKHQRRAPRQRVEDVAITEASGLTLGMDGYPHPLETTPEGNLRSVDSKTVDLLGSILFELRQIREGLVTMGIIDEVV